MKTIFLSLALAFSAAGATAIEPPSYGGNWTLDVAQSRDLPPFYVNVKSHRLTITQDAAHLNVGVDIDAGQPQPMHTDFPYPLDGSEAHVQTTLRMPGGPVRIPTTLRAEMHGDGSVHVTIVRQLPMPDGPVEARMTEDWKLRPDGRTLDIHMVDDSPRGHHESDYVFVRS